MAGVVLKALILSCVVCFLWPVTAAAGNTDTAYLQLAKGPPDWAPAKGYRKKKHEHRHAHGDNEGGVAVVVELPWRPHVDTRFVVDGRCNREQVGAVLGGVIGGIAGSNMGDGDDRTLTTLAGVVAGALIGKTIGKRMDRADRHCTSQVMERVRDGHAVVWTNPHTHRRYHVKPIKTYRNRRGHYCRDYETRVTHNGRKQVTRETACRQGDGDWRL